MTDIQTTMRDFAARQAEREAHVHARIANYKQAVIVPLRAAGIARVEVRFEGYGDSGAIEDCTFYDATGAIADEPQVLVDRHDQETSKAEEGEAMQTLREALDSLTYLALERHHPGWEINDGAAGELVINVASATFTLECQLRYVATDDHSTGL